jgi:hypothetical protein
MNDLMEILKPRLERKCLKGVTFSYDKDFKKISKKKIKTKNKKAKTSKKKEIPQINLKNIKKTFKIQKQGIKNNILIQEEEEAKEEKEPTKFIINYSPEIGESTPPEQTFMNQSSSISEYSSTNSSGACKFTKKSLTELSLRLLSTQQNTEENKKPDFSLPENDIFNINNIEDIIKSKNEIIESKKTTLKNIEKENKNQMEEDEIEQETEKSNSINLSEILKINSEIIEESENNDDIIEIEEEEEDSDDVIFIKENKKIETIKETPIINVKEENIVNYN